MQVHTYGYWITSTVTAAILQSFSKTYLLSIMNEFGIIGKLEDGQVMVHVGLASATSIVKSKWLWSGEIWLFFSDTSSHCESLLWPENCNCLQHHSIALKFKEFDCKYPIFKLKFCLQCIHGIPPSYLIDKITYNVWNRTLRKKQEISTEFDVPLSRSLLLFKKKLRLYVKTIYLYIKTVRFKILFPLFVSIWMIHVFTLVKLLSC